MVLALEGLGLAVMAHTASYSHSLVLEDLHGAFQTYTSDFIGVDPSCPIEQIGA